MNYSVYYDTGISNRLIDNPDRAARDMKQSIEYLDAIEKFRKQGINIDNLHLITSLFGASFDGYKIPNFTISEDERWVCVPVLSESPCNPDGDWEWIPKCYEVDSMYTTFVTIGGMSYSYKTILVKDA